MDLYLDVLRSHPWPAQYWKALEYFARVKASNVIEPLMRLVYTPEPGSEAFYRDIIRAVTKIGDKRAIAPVRGLLSSTWKWYRNGQLVKTTGPEWIREDLLAALSILRPAKSE